MKGVCCVCKVPVSMAPEGEGPIVCCGHSPEFIMRHLGDMKPEEMNAWGKGQVEWARKVLAGEIPLVPES